MLTMFLVVSRAAHVLKCSQLSFMRKMDITTVADFILSVTEICILTRVLNSTKILAHRNNLYHRCRNRTDCASKKRLRNLYIDGGKCGRRSSGETTAVNWWN